MDKSSSWLEPSDQTHGSFSIIAKLAKISIQSKTKSLRGIVFGDPGQLGHLVLNLAAGAEPKIDLAPRLGLNGLVEPLVLDPEETANLAIDNLVQRIVFGEDGQLGQLVRDLAGAEPVLDIASRLRLKAMVELVQDLEVTANVATHNLVQRIVNGDPGQLGVLVQNLARGEWKHDLVTRPGLHDLVDHAQNPEVRAKVAIHNHVQREDDQRQN